MKMNEMVDAADIIYEEAGEDANVIFGCVTDDRLNDSQEIHVTVVATGINSDYKDEQSPFYKKYTKSNDYYDKDATSDNKGENINDQILVNSNIEKNISSESNQNINKDLSIPKKDDNDQIENGTRNMFTFGEEDLEVPAFLRNNN